MCTTIGKREKPDSLTKILVRFSTSAFLKSRPLLLFPVFDGLLIALGGPFSRFLHAPTDLSQDATAMILMMADAKDAFDRLSQLLTCPDVSPRSKGFSTRCQECWQRCTPLIAHPRLGPLCHASSRPLYSFFSLSLDPWALHSFVPP